jgi:glycosyltransferase involved in cell wall biosynthesis
MSSTKSSTNTIYFAVPGDLNTITGGYGYDREIIAGLQRLGVMVITIRLSDEFPRASAQALNETAEIFAKLPDDATVIVDCLAFGVMDVIASAESERLNLLALCHHPLALETGVEPAAAERLRQSETRALKAARAVIVTSAATRRLLIEEFDIPAEKITLAPPGTRRPQQAILRRAPENRTPVLLTLATLTRRKGHDTLIAALATIRHLDWRARFVGGAEFDPEWANWLKNEVARLDLAERVEFVGSVKDPVQELTNADLFVLPSRFEGYGMAFAEALAFGLPVVAGRAGAVPDLVPPDAGILVPPDQPDALADALARLLTDAEFLQQLQRGALRVAATLPTWESSTQVIAELIRDVQSGRFL